MLESLIIFILNMDGSIPKAVTMEVMRAKITVLVLCKKCIQMCM